VDAARFDLSPVNLDLGTTYYWKVTEVNEAEAPAAWPGDVWEFSTPEYLVVDDFESYTDDEGNEIFSSWVDGFNIPTNGSQVGHDIPPYAERTTVHGDSQSMPFSYGVGGATVSEATVTFDPAQDWSKHGIRTLALYFQGAAGNAPAQLYVKVNGKKKVYNGTATSKLMWTPFQVDLTALGTNLARVTTLTIGVEGAGTGVLYFDDLRLYQQAPQIVIPREEVWVEAESATSITLPMRIFDDPEASGGQCIGTEPGTGNVTANPPEVDGTAKIPFTVIGGTYRILGRVIIPADDSFWIRIQGATTNTTNHASGWVRWSDPPNGDTWHWDAIFSTDDANTDVEWTMAAGTYTLEVAYREDGALVDGFLIQSLD